MADDELYVPTPEEVSVGERPKRVSFGDLIARVVRWPFRPGVGESKTVRTVATPNDPSVPKIGGGHETLNVASPRATSAKPESVQTAAVKNARPRRGISISPDVVRRRGERMQGPPGPGNPGS
jgi:hypothetical protein